MSWTFTLDFMNIEKRNIQPKVRHNWCFVLYVGSYFNFKYHGHYVGVFVLRLFLPLLNKEVEFVNIVNGAKRNAFRYIVAGRV